MFNVGAFAGGLAQGVRSGQEMQIKARAADRLAQEADREGKMHEFRMDKAVFEKDKRARLKAANEEIAAGWSNEGQATADKPGVPAGGGLKEISPLNQPEALPAPATSPATRSQADSLMSQYGKLARSQTQPVPLQRAEEAIAKRMLTGDLLENADELTRMANIYKKHGLLTDMLPWMNRVYAAKKKRIPDAMHLLLNGDPQGAREALRQGGVNLAEDPIRLDSGDKQNTGWTFRVHGSPEEEIDLRELARKFVPNIYLNTQL
jgi:hypothetical protein